MLETKAALESGQRDAFVRSVRLGPFLRGRPPSRQLARDARAFASLRFAPIRAATPETLRTWLGGRHSLKSLFVCFLIVATCGKRFQILPVTMKAPCHRFSAARQRLRRLPVQ